MQRIFEKKSERKRLDEVVSGFRRFSLKNAAQQKANRVSLPLLNGLEH